MQLGSNFFSVKTLNFEIALGSKVDLTLRAKPRLSRTSWQLMGEGILRTSQKKHEEKSTGYPRPRSRPTLLLLALRPFILKAAEVARCPVLHSVAESFLIE